VFDKIFFEFCVTFLIFWSMRVSKLIKGDVFYSFFERFLEPSINQGSSSLDRVGFFICEGYEVNGVIFEIVDTGKSCYSLSVSIIYKPLSYLVGTKGSNTFIIIDIITLDELISPMFYMGFFECFNKGI
jgi:hypothetical protein